MIYNFSKFQIGGLPGHRATEHLFSLKSIMCWYDCLDLPLIVQFYDLKKYFDSENLRDAMNTLYDSNIKGKIYRLMYELNSSSMIRVKTGCGTTDRISTGENVAQGSISGALISSLNLDFSVTRDFKESTQEISYHHLPLSPMIFQDDCNRCATTAAGAHAGNNILFK